MDEARLVSDLVALGRAVAVPLAKVILRPEIQGFCVLCLLAEAALVDQGGVDLLLPELRVVIGPQRLGLDVVRARFCHPAHQLVAVPLELGERDPVVGADLRRMQIVVGDPAQDRRAGHAEALSHLGRRQQLHSRRKLHDLALGLGRVQEGANRRPVIVGQVSRIDRQRAAHGPMIQRRGRLWTSKCPGIEEASTVTRIRSQCAQPRCATARDLWAEMHRLPGRLSGKFRQLVAN